MASNVGKYYNQKENNLAGNISTKVIQRITNQRFNDYYNKLYGSAQSHYRDQPPRQESTKKINYETFRYPSLQQLHRQAWLDKNVVVHRSPNRQPDNGSLEDGHEVANVNNQRSQSPDRDKQSSPTHDRPCRVRYGSETGRHNWLGNKTRQRCTTEVQKHRQSRSNKSTDTSRTRKSEQRNDRPNNKRRQRTKPADAKKNTEKH